LSYYYNFFHCDLKVKEVVKKVEESFHSLTMEKVKKGEIEEREKEQRVKDANSRVEASRRQQLEERAIQRERQAEEDRVRLYMLMLHIYCFVCFVFCLF
jgi:t-SNARE complex subunit (syntaxin)